MIRLPRIRWRIGLILFIGFIAMLSIPIALFYMLRGADQITGLPQPQQLAAMAHLLEHTPPADRDKVIAAFRSAQMSLRVAGEARVEADLEPLWPADPGEIARYRAALQARDFAAYAVPRKLFRNGFMSPLRAAEFRIALRDGGVLIVASESVAIFTEGGVPIGVPPAFFGVLVAFVALILLNREFRPVRRLAKAVEALDPSDPEARLPNIRAGTEEVRQLIRAFGRQQDRVATLLQARSALVGGIQHDVRTFATRLRLHIENLANGRDRRQAEADIDDLVSLMDSALLATRSEVGKLDLELIDIVEVLDAEIRDRRAAGGLADLTLDASAAGAQILGDRLALRRIVSNLVENAIRYGHAAHLRLETQNTELVLCIDDEGAGFPPESRAVLVEPFSRRETSRARQTGGAGLGLAIVRSLVEAHDGTIRLAETETGSGRVIVRLPLFQPEATF